MGQKMKGKKKKKKSPITSLFLSSLTPHKSEFESGSILVPNLRSLSIKVKDTLFDDEAFVNMVSFRWLPDLSRTPESPMEPPSK
ncbi:hypothetical protein BT96DRAFT_913620 [Gymnopus androsaceus JB14]|uniref:Uncharacterized protein n=1 Tax=Gymnopus androsaceus JB14 TaxID=1447944 RepID=A0A6A4IK74_9AGAR|nr:hypothetical protein BT96DRAFT_913620 [Gymnopus androsaceus JB14]